jgi:hypothetical protein
MRLMSGQNVVRRGRGRSLVSNAALDFNFLSGALLDPRLTLSRPGAGWRYNSAGILSAVASNLPRFDYAPATLAPLGLLIEPQRINLCLNSSTVGVGAGWADGAGGNDGGNLVVTGNAAIAPDGTTTATLINDSSTVTVLGRQQPVAVSASNNYYTASAHIKAGTSSVAAVRVTIGGGTSVVGDAVINLATGAAQWRAGNPGFGQPVVQACGNGWYRLCITVKDVLANANTFLTMECRPAFAPAYSDTLQMSAMGSAYFFGAQIEVGQAATSYTPTTSGQATRYADVVTLPASFGAAIFGRPALTIYAEYMVCGLTGTNQFVHDVTNGTVSREAGLYINNSGTSSIANASAANAVPYLAGVPAVGAIYKHALSLKDGQLLTSLNGVNAGGGAPSPMPVLDRMTLGNRVDASFPGHMWLRKIKVFTASSTQSQLQALTS